MIGPRVALAALLLLAAACSRSSDGRPTAPPPAAPTAPAVAGELRVGSRGAVTAMRIAAGKLSFCDEGGLHEIALPSGQVTAGAGACPDAARAPQATGPEVTVRTPDLGPNDIVEIDGVAQSFPIEGHARDWASDAGKVVVVGTGTQVLKIDAAKSQPDILTPQGSERVAVGAGWAAWWTGTSIVARRL